MELDIEAFRELYLHTLKTNLRTPDEEVLAVAAESLDETLENLITPRQKALEDITTNPKYSHAVKGVFDSRDQVRATKGPHPQIRKLALPEEFWYRYHNLRDMEEDHGYANFIGRVTVQTTEDLMVVRLSYHDNTEDGTWHRQGCWTDYTLIMPAELGETSLAQIRRDPTIMIDAYRAIFPDCDNSDGKLQLHRRSLIEIPS